MPISFKSERKKLLKQMYGDVTDAYIEELIKNKQLTPEEQEERRGDAEEWKIEFKELLKDIKKYLAYGDTPLHYVK